MILMNGYTLGFFFPRQVMHIPATPQGPQIDIKAETRKPDLSRTRPDAESESREVPAAYYFHRYF